MTLLEALEPSAFSTISVIGVPVTALSLDEQATAMQEWAKQRQSRVVCVANVHMLMEAHRHPDFAEVLCRADLVTPDGMPLVWMMRRLGNPSQTRLAGLDVFGALCRRAAAAGVGIYFLGSTEDVLAKISERLQQDYPALRVAGLESPPFRPLTAEEDQSLVDRINNSGAGFVFVALGCPKQERWMDEHKGRIQGVMVGLGGAFPVYAGIHKRAPRWLREAGGEWAYRLLQEPRRLWKRYWDTNLPFLVLASRQLNEAKRQQNRSH